MTDSIFSATARNSAESYTIDIVQQLYPRFHNKVGPMVDPNHGIAWRIKSEAAIEAKLRRRGSDKAINDFIGIRILAIHIGLLDQIEEKLIEWESDVGLLRVMRTSLFEAPDKTGYRAIHLDYRLAEPGTVGLTSSATLEVQLTTWLQHLHGTLSHSLFYKSTHSERLTKVAALSAMSDRLHEIDKEIAYRVTMS